MGAQEYRYDTEVVRLFYDHASTVVWFPYPVPYEESGLSPTLVADLQAWGRLHDTGLDHEQQWRSPELPAMADEQRQGLAHRLGDELGSAFEVEFDVPRGVWFGPRKTSYRSSEPPTNPEAAAIFTAWADEARAERAELAQRAAEGWSSDESFGWYAVQPDSGQKFVPRERPTQE
ncbi:hypothetical protein ASE14_15155 [Agromyces sp. Root81]|uniref:hypothetical protein n=1 Tax=Agromyces sp. Root81 TaxID=1736601 RepID=UPI0006FB8DEB|nr:hypothetical protein [Agromyces sp. Root81]KRC59117.1 hypothetical protein ASE14_15155 [Agromyces sp. Root81]